jgi:hypothetical protein
VDSGLKTLPQIVDTKFFRISEDVFKRSLEYLREKQGYTWPFFFSITLLCFCFFLAALKACLLHNHTQRINPWKPIA